MKNRSARSIALGIIIFAGLAIGVLCAYRVMHRGKLHVDVDRTDYPVVGIDVSSHNGVPDFDSIYASGIDFVYIKASEGRTFKDQIFARNYSAATRAGVITGAYHFFRFDCDGTLQAQNFLSCIKDLNLDLPLAIDIEESGNPIEQPTELIIERLRTMISILEASGYKVLVYTNKNGHARFIHRVFPSSGHDLWICSFTTPPISYERWTLWQHSHISRVPGIVGKVDMNTFNGSREVFYDHFNIPYTKRKSDL